ncbi:MAG: Asp-tRNA(Asn)/Glu-tRNA(Gln) amidotransferase subunit GatC [Defluviitaleaceae bacterium]|nr:Asp-tRNA(Asn)/Glu-tRNA(Gln) amidotransferase subunit GatC [Defluviitaleaceae bacterium]
MKVDDNLMTYLEGLSNMTISADEQHQLAEGVQGLIDSASGLSTLNTEGVPECIHIVDVVNAFRNDIAQPSFGREKILQNAPNHNDEMIIAPRTVE